MMRVIVRTKDGYGQDIKEGVISVLDENGVGHTGRIEPGCDLAVIIGGDGTLLRDHSWIDCPIMGINAGSSVGFYTKACGKDYRKRLTSLLNGRAGKDYFIHELTRLQASVNGRRIDAQALNEVLVSPTYVRRLMDARLQVGGKESLERCSAIIVYTPTGSNAFANSAGAKKLGYDSGKIGITALAPYSGTLRGRDMTLGRCQVKITYLGDEGEACIDGSEVNIRRLKRGDVVRVEMGKKPTRLVGFRPRLY